MGDQHDDLVAPTPVATAPDSHAPAPKPRGKPAHFDAVALQQNMFWTVPEAAFIARVGVRTVWRLMADPKSGFPKARRVRGRTLLPRDGVLKFLAEGAAR